MDDLDTTLYISAPFSMSFPSNGRASGRSLSSVGSDFSRSSMYKHIETYMGEMTGADGHACLLRAMCEASSHPLHDEGLIGDAVNFLLTANYAAEETDKKFKKYLGAQAKGQVNKSKKRYVGK